MGFFSDIAGDLTSGKDPSELDKNEGKQPRAKKKLCIQLMVIMFLFFMAPTVYTAVNPACGLLIGAGAFFFLCVWCYAVTLYNKKEYDKVENIMQQCFGGGEKTGGAPRGIENNANTFAAGP